MSLFVTEQRFSNRLKKKRLSSSCRVLRNKNKIVVNVGWIALVKTEPSSRVRPKPSASEPLYEATIRVRPSTGIPEYRYSHPNWSPFRSIVSNPNCKLQSLPKSDLGPRVSATESSKKFRHGFRRVQSDSQAVQNGRSLPVVTRGQVLQCDNL
jgi:hypothetical protein